MKNKTLRVGFIGLEKAPSEKKRGEIITMLKERLEKVEVVKPGAKDITLVIRVSKKGKVSFIENLAVVIFFSNLKSPFSPLKTICLQSRSSTRNRRYVEEYLRNIDLLICVHGGRWEQRLIEKARSRRRKKLVIELRKRRRIPGVFF